MLNYLSKEEQANTWTHLVATVVTVLIAWPLIALAYRSQLIHHQYEVFGTVLFVVGMCMMYLSSTLYHAVTNVIHKRRLRVLDHVAIYVMIAGSYSLLCVSVLGGWMGWTLFGFMWTCVIVGFVGKLIALGKYPKLSLALYLIMGWTALLVIVPIYQHLSLAAFLWIIGEGLAYSIGAYFFRLDEEHAFYHAIWHVFIMLGSLCHTFATILILL